MRVLALDWGTVRIGGAVSDEEGKIAFAIDKPFAELEEIKSFCAEKNVEKIIIGIPLSLEGRETESTRAAQKFKQQLNEALGIPIDEVDERFSSQSAERQLSESGLSSKKQRTIKDNSAAQIMLQNYLDKQNN